MLFQRLILRRTPFEYNENKTLSELDRLYDYMRNFYYLIGLEQWYFSLIWNT